MTDTVIKVENLSKRYRLGELHRQTGSFREIITGSFRKAFRSTSLSSNATRHPLCSKQSSHDDYVWALRNVSFEVKRGEILGIIGRNGAGKSTLLKILSRITKPTEGKAKITGRVGSLLEVGTGFHPELTGRENIFLNGAILGMAKAEIKAKFKEIVDFAEINKFIDTPIKRYSTGMYVRLAFAVSAHLEPEILLVDEVLAVGDAEFQKKCIGKISDVAANKKTVLFVSHNLTTIEKLCQKVIVLKEGRIDFLGNVNEGIEHYFLEEGKPKNGLDKNLFSGTFYNTISITSIELNGNCAGSICNFSPSDGISFKLNGYAYKNISQCTFFIAIEQKGIRIATLRDTDNEKQLNKGVFCSEVSIPPFLLRPGAYSFSAGVTSHKLKMWLWGRDLGKFSIKRQWNKHYKEDEDGIINIPFSGKRTQLEISD